jgi:hypothetical protein
MIGEAFARGKTGALIPAQVPALRLAAVLEKRYTLLLVAG